MFNAGISCSVTQRMPNTFARLDLKIYFWRWTEVHHFRSLLYIFTFCEIATPQEQHPLILILMMRLIRKNMISIRLNKKTSIIILILFSFFSEAYSCGCVGGIPDLKTSLKSSKSIFAGKILSKKAVIVDTLLSLTHYLYNYEYIVEVQQKIKGCSLPKTIKVYSGMGNGDCGYLFEIGKSYVIHADREKLETYDGKISEKVYSTHICKRPQGYNTEEYEALCAIMRKKAILLE